MKLPEPLQPLADSNRELIAIDGKLFQIHFELLGPEQMDINTRKTLIEMLAGDNEAQEGLRRMGKLDVDWVQFGICNFGGYDNKADIENGIANREYYNCPYRGQCPGEGFVCKHLKAGEENISPAEMKVLRLVGRDIAPKQIAGILFLSEHTVRNHIRAIKDKINEHTTTAVALWAQKKGVI